MAQAGEVILSPSPSSGASMDASGVMALLNTASPGVLGAGASILGAAVAQPPVTSGINSSPVDVGIDHSGWNVNFGGGSISSAATKSSDNPVTWIVVGAGLIALAIVVRAWKGK